MIADWWEGPEGKSCGRCRGGGKAPLQEEGLCCIWVDEDFDKNDGSLLFLSSLDLGTASSFYMGST